MVTSFRLVLLVFLWKLTREQFHLRLSLRHHFLYSLLGLVLLSLLLVFQLVHGAVAQLRLFLCGLWVRQIVHGNGKEDVEEDVVATDEQKYEVEADEESKTLQ